jgi:hypothetical protein
VAAGGLAAALSTADELLLTIANALSHDFYYKMIDPNASTRKRVFISKLLLLFVALGAAYVAQQRPADILFLVSRSQRRARCWRSGSPACSRRAAGAYAEGLMSSMTMSPLTPVLRKNCVRRGSAICRLGVERCGTMSAWSPSPGSHFV